MEKKVKVMLLASVICMIIISAAIACMNPISAKAAGLVLFIFVIVFVLIKKRKLVKY